MPYARPTLTEIAARVKTDLAGSLAGSAAFFRRSFERGVQAAMTGVSHLLHAHLAWVARQLDPRQADSDILESVHGEPYGIPRKPAVAAQLELAITGTNGTSIPATTVWTRADGATFTVNTTVIIAGGTATAEITAVEPGAAGNTESGTTLDIETPIVGVDSTATVGLTLIDGSDIEDDDDYLARILARRRSGPRGGAPGDFEFWVLEVPGITRAWEIPRLEGAGTVAIYAVNDDADPITLTASKIAEAEDYLDSPGREPTTATATVYTPTLDPLDPEINLAPNTPEVQAAVVAELEALLLREATPEGFTLLLSQINESISLAAGEVDHVTVSPAADVVYPVGTLPIVGTPTWGSI